MRDDVSSIPKNGCNVLNSDVRIYNYNGNVRREYIQIGGKWFHNSTQTAYNPYDVSQYACIDVSDLNSNAVFEPILYWCSFGLFLVAVGLFFYVLKRAFYAIKVD